MPVLESIEKSRSWTGTLLPVLESIEKMQAMSKSTVARAVLNRQRAYGRSNVAGAGENLGEGHC